MIFSLSRLKLSSKLLVIAFLPLLVTIVPALWYVFFLQGDLARRSVLLIAVLLGLLFFYSAGVFLFIKRLTAFMGMIGEAAADLSSGKPVAFIANTRTDEMGAIAQAVNVLNDELKRKANFAEQISTGNLGALYQSASGSDTFGHSLLTIKDNLIRIKEEDAKRIWATEALASFVEVLRSQRNLKALSNDIIINLVKTLKANQGTIFMVNQDQAGDTFLDMQACYAHKRTKYLTQRIAPGEGLIGQAFLEKRTLYLKKVPDNFIRITSGLGDENPRSILITPLKTEDEVVGIAELASFKEFSAHEIAFVEKIGESIAHTILSFRTAENTKKLLEESQVQAEYMRSQEEELRQNQEELQATQEEISRKYDALFAQLTELNHLSKFDQLKSITSTKKRNIEYYFDIIRNQILTFSEDKMIIEAVNAFKTAFYKIDQGVPEQRMSSMKENLKRYYTKEFIPRLNDTADQFKNADHYFPEDTRAVVLQYLYISDNPHPTGKKSLLDDAKDGSEYSSVHAAYHPTIRNFLEKFGYYDIFLLDSKTGDMLYSVFKEVDFATSLLTGLYGETNFGHVVQEAIESDDKDFVRLIDFEPYDPSYHAPASFIACPVYDGDEKTGILVFQMPINKINQILTGDHKWQEDGLGESGETFIAGSDYRLRTIARELIENKTAYLSGLARMGYADDIIRQVRKTNTSILLEKIQLESVTKALKGETGTQLETDGRGIRMLNAFAPLDIPDVQWIIMSTMKEEEASVRINSLREGKI
jgi:GAF domain-containing protein